MTNEFPLKVNGARTILRVHPVENKTLGGIIIPGAEEANVSRGTVMAVGTGQRLDNGTEFPMTVEVGDEVIFSPMQGAPVDVPGHEGNYIVLNEAHILAVVQ